jgi:DNA-binding beta-propeller fold protein YncE
MHVLGRDNLTQIRTSEVVRTLDLADATDAPTSCLAYSPENGYLYSCDTRSNCIAVINTDLWSWDYEWIDNITGIEHPCGITFNPVDGNVYVLSRDDSNSLYRILSTTNKVQKIAEFGEECLASGGEGDSLVYNPVTDKLYVAAEYRTISVIDPRTGNITSNIPAPIGSDNLAFNPKNGYVYVLGAGSSFGHSFVSVIDPVTNTMVGRSSWIG